MIYEVYTPSWPLNEFINNFTYYKHHLPAHNIERFLPDGNIELVIDLGDAPQFLLDNETLAGKQECRNMWLSGVRTGYITIPSGNQAEMFLIFFKKGKMFPFLKRPVSEITNTVTNADLVFGKD